MKRKDLLVRNSIIIGMISIIVAGGIVIYRLSKKLRTLANENACLEFEAIQKENQIKSEEQEEENTRNMLEEQKKEYEKKQAEYMHAMIDLRKQIQDMEEEMKNLKRLNIQAGDSLENAIAQQQLTKEFAEKMSRILVTLQNVSSQMKILSLNASIEAARIGDEGREFAEVAEKIRMLSGNSVNSATEIDELLRELIDNLEENISKMQRLNANVKFDK